MEYDHERAVADGVNLDFEVYNIRTRITERGSTIEASPNTMVEYRNRQTRQRRWEQPDEDITYDANELDRRVVAKDQIRTIVRTFRDLSRLAKQCGPEEHARVEEMSSARRRPRSMPASFLAQPSW